MEKADHIQKPGSSRTPEVRWYHAAILSIISTIAAACNHRLPGKNVTETAVMSEAENFSDLELQGDKLNFIGRELLFFYQLTKGTQNKLLQKTSSFILEDVCIWLIDLYLDYDMRDLDEAGRKEMTQLTEAANKLKQLYSKMVIASLKGEKVPDFTQEIILMASPINEAYKKVLARFPANVNLHSLHDKNVFGFEEKTSGREDIIRKMRVHSLKKLTFLAQSLKSIEPIFKKHPIIRRKIAYALELIRMVQQLESTSGGLGKYSAETIRQIGLEIELAFAEINTETFEQNTGTKSEMTRYPETDVIRKIYEKTFPKAKD